MKKHLKRLLSFVSILSIVLTTILLPKASTDIKVVVQNTPKIDVMLTSKETNLDLTNFENDVKNKLEQKGIKTNDINFITAETKTAGTSSDDVDVDSVINNWRTLGAKTWKSTNGQIYSYNTSNCSGFTALLSPTANYDNVHIDATRVHAGTLNNGIAFNVTVDSSGRLSGYFLSLSNHANNYLALYKFNNVVMSGWAVGVSEILWCNPTQIDLLNTYNYKNTVGQRVLINYNYSAGTYGSFSCLAYYEKDPGNNAKIHVDCEDGNIVVYANEQKIIDVYDSTYKSGTYGFWGNNCEQVDYMYLKDIKFSSTYFEYKTFKEILTQNAWRNDAKHIVVNVDNAIDDTLTGQNTIGEILSRTLADDIHFIQWGTDTNKSATTNFIKQNDNKGMFVYNNDYQQAINSTANYIESLIGIEEETGDQYITIGQELNLFVTPDNFKNNATSDNYPNGRWKINHDYKHFTNNLGQSADSGVYTPNLNCNFDKPGKYEITFDDEVVKTIYVHRTPIADFEINIENLVLNLQNVSYDLDTEANNGIASEKWYYKEVSEANWTEGKLTQLDKTKIYVIKLEVTDYQGATSYTTKYVGTGNPVSKFNFANDVICKFNILEINNTSYDPIGYDIKSESWELKKDGKLVGTYSSPILDFNTSDLGPGNYTYTLTVINSAGTKSEAYTKSFTIIDDIVKPEITIDVETNNTWLPDIDVPVEVSDNESYISKWRYEFVTSPTPTKTDADWSDWDIEETKVNINSGALSGRYYLHIQAYDEANNLTERTVGPFNLDNTNPVINGVDVEKLGFRDNKVTIHAFDEHSGIVGYALTKYEPTTYSARTITTPELPEFQESNEFNVDRDGLYQVWAIDALGNIETSVCEVTQSNQTDKTTTVYAEIGSEFKVTIPKKIVLDGATKSGTYQVTVEGDIAGLEIVNVTPDSAVTLSSKDKADVIGTITQDKLNWTYSEMYADSKILANGSISASGITAGAWNGTFNFAIKLENNGKYTNSEWYVEYQDITFDMEELDNSEATEPTE